MKSFAVCDPDTALTALAALDAKLTSLQVRNKHLNLASSIWPHSVLTWVVALVQRCLPGRRKRHVDLGHLQS